MDTLPDLQNPDTAPDGPPRLHMTSFRDHVGLGNGWERASNPVLASPRARAGPILAVLMSFCAVAAAVAEARPSSVRGRGRRKRLP